MLKSVLKLSKKSRARALGLAAVAMVCVFNSSGAQAAVVTEETRDDGVRRVVKFKDEPDQFGTGVKQGFWMHSLGLSHEH